MRTPLVTALGIGAVITALTLPTIAASGQEGPKPGATRVVDDAGNPVERAHVWFMRGHDTDIAGDDRYGPIVQLKGLTDAQGRLPARVRAGGTPDQPVVTSSCFLVFDGDRAAFQCWDIGQGDIALEPATRVRVRLRSGDGAAVPKDIVVRLHFPGGNCSHGIDLSPRDGGVFESPPLPASKAEVVRLHLTLSAPDLWSGPYDIRPPDSDGVSAIDVIPVRTVTGRVVDSSGKVVPNATVWSHNPAAAYVMDGLKTGDDGTFALSGVLCDETGVYVRAPGLAASRAAVPAGRAKTELGDIVLLKGRRITGRVVEEDGVDVVSFAVFVQDSHGARIATAEAKGAGRFETDRVPNGPVTLRVYLHWSAGIAGARGATKDVGADENDVALVVPTGVRIRLVDSDGKPTRVSSADVRFSFDGDPAGEQRYDGTRYGAFSEIRVPLSRDTAGGQLSVAVTTNDGRTGTGTRTVEAGGRGDVEVQLVPGR